MKLVWCNGFPEIYSQLQGDMKIIWCNGFPEIYAQLQAVQLTEVYVHATICKTTLV